MKRSEYLGCGIMSSRSDREEVMKQRNDVTGIKILVLVVMYSRLFV